MNDNTLGIMPIASFTHSNDLGAIKFQAFADKLIFELRDNHLEHKAFITTYRSFPAGTSLATIKAEFEEEIIRQQGCTGDWGIDSGSHPEAELSICFDMIESLQDGGYIKAPDNYPANPANDLTLSLPFGNNGRYCMIKRHTYTGEYCIYLGANTMGGYSCTIGLTTNHGQDQRASQDIRQDFLKYLDGTMQDSNGTDNAGFNALQRLYTIYQDMTTAPPAMPDPAKA